MAAQDQWSFHRLADHGEESSYLYGYKMAGGCTIAEHCNMTGRKKGGRTCLESVAVLEPHDMFVPIVVCERLAEPYVEGIVKTDIGPHPNF